MRGGDLPTASFSGVVTLHQSQEACAGGDESFTAPTASLRAMSFVGAKRTGIAAFREGRTHVSASTTDYSSDVKNASFSAKAKGDMNEGGTDLTLTSSSPDAKIISIMLNLPFDLTEEEMKKRHEQEETQFRVKFRGEEFHGGGTTVCSYKFSVMKKFVPCEMVDDSQK